MTSVRTLASRSLRMSEEGLEADGGSSDGASLAEARIVVQGQVRCCSSYLICCVHSLCSP